MSKHSKKYLDTKASNQEREAQIRQEIDEESDRLDSAIKGIGVSLGISAGVAGLGYMAYRSTIKSSKKKKKGQDKRSHQRQASISEAWYAPILIAVGKNILNQVVSSLADQTKKKKDN